jgi:hypothetical protein
VRQSVRHCVAMDVSNLGTRVQELLDGGGGEPCRGAADRFLPLVTLESGARCGLDREARWLLVPDDGRPATRCTPDTAHLFHEALEWKRTRFDDALEAGARAHGLPADEVVFAFPTVDVIRGVLAKQHPYLTRLALEWLRPTELRALRADLREVTRTASMPLPVKDLAERLIVPE